MNREGGGMAEEGAGAGAGAGLGPGSRGYELLRRAGWREGVRESVRRGQ